MKYVDYQRYLNRLRWTEQGVPPEIQEILQRMEETESAMKKMQSLFGGRIKS